MTSAVPESLRVLLSNLIDYAGFFPPAGLPLPSVLERYRCFRASPDSWILNRLVLPVDRLQDVVLERGWRITLLADTDPGLLPPQVETLESKGTQRFSLPTYCEAPLDRISGAFAKVRTGGLTPESIPPAAWLADFLCDAAARRLPFKATAGLHHPLRAVYPLTYAADSPTAVMHGFLNVFIAAAFAWRGASLAQVTGVLEETAPDAFRFDTRGLAWQGHALSTEEIQRARRDFAHSFGSCSFEEPVAGLRQLELIP